MSLGRGVWLLGRERWGPWMAQGPDPSVCAWKTSRVHCTGWLKGALPSTGTPHRLPRASPPSLVSASSDVADSLFTQLPYRFPLSSQHPLRAMAANGLDSTYACHCLNVRVTHQPTSETPPQADKDFASVHCGDSGITIVRPAQQHPRRTEGFTIELRLMSRLLCGLEVVQCPIRMARSQGVLDLSPSHA